MRLRTGLCLAAWALLLSSCSAEPTGSHDAGDDAGIPDAGLDAGAPDAGLDAGIADAGIDAGVPDAGLDAGAHGDAGGDAGLEDAGIDAGPADAGVDGGSSADSGFASELWTSAMFSSGKVRGFNWPGDLGDPNSLVDMAATGANLVRIFLPVHYDAGSDTYGIDMSTSDTSLSAVTSTVASGAQNGFKVVIVFAPDSTDYWTDTNAQNSLAADWAQIATQFDGNPAVAAYDLINEPVPPAPADGGTELWVNLATQLMTTIRANDPDHVIVFEPTHGASPVGLLTDGGQGFTPSLVGQIQAFGNVVYSVHYYLPFDITNQGLTTYTTQEIYPSAPDAGHPADPPTLAAALAPVDTFVATYGYPIYLGEFSCVRWAPLNQETPSVPTANAWLRDLIPLFESRGYAWSYHDWRSYDGWDAEIPESFYYQFPYVAALPQVTVPDGGYASLRTDTTDSMILLESYFQSNAH